MNNVVASGSEVPTRKTGVRFMVEAVKIRIKPSRDNLFEISFPDKTLVSIHDAYGGSNGQTEFIIFY